MFAESILCRTIAFFGGSVHSVRRCATSFYSFRGREFQRQPSFARNDLWREFRISRERRLAAFYKFELISAILGLFQKAQACQLYTFQDVLNQVRLVRVHFCKCALPKNCSNSGYS